jgi:hypothetical protein
MNTLFRYRAGNNGHVVWVELPLLAGGAEEKQAS